MLELQLIPFAGWALTEGQHRPKAGKKKKTRMKEKVFLGKWSAIAMLELQRIQFAGWALTEGQLRPKAGWFPLRKRCSIEKGVNRLFPAQ